MMKLKLCLAGVVMALTTLKVDGGAVDRKHEPSHELHSSEAALLAIPGSLAVEHQHLHEVLGSLVGRKEPVGSAARFLADLLEPHFQKENSDALPLLGLLATLGRGEITDVMRPAIETSKKLKAGMPEMIAEHKSIKAALDGLRKAGERANDRDAMEFAEELSLHAQTEEEVLYPAAILVGAYIETQLRPSTPKNK